MVGRPDVVLAPQLGRLTNLVQAYALERSGRGLNGGDFQALHTHLAGAEHARARSLLDRFSRGSKSDFEAGDVELSEPCAEAIKSKLEKAFAYFAKRLVEIFFGCVLGDEMSQDCIAATAKVDNFLEDLTAKCKADGDFCNITGVTFERGQRVEESQGVCVPVACHAEAKQAIKYFKEQMGEQIADLQAQEGRDVEEQSSLDDCGNCTIHIRCSSSGSSGEQPPQDSEPLAHM